MEGKKNYTFRIESEVVQAARAQAELKGISLNQFVELAIQSLVVAQGVQEAKKQGVEIPPFMREGWKPGKW